MKALKTLALVLVVLGGLIYFGVWYAFRTTSEDISHLRPFSKLIGKELKTIQPCFIALNYEHWVHENSYVIAMKQQKLSGNIKNLEELPIGSVLRIKKAKQFTNGVTGFKSTHLLGSVFLERLKKEVQFEFAWGSKNYGTDLPGDYFSYSLAPWQEQPIDLMYNYKENLEAPIRNTNTQEEKRLEN